MFREGNENYKMKSHGRARKNEANSRENSRDREFSLVSATYTKTNKQTNAKTNAKEIQKQINLPKSDPDTLFIYKKTISNNVKKYISNSISSSIQFVKESYEYINNTSL